MGIEFIIMINACKVRFVSLEPLFVELLLPVALLLVVELVLFGTMIILLPLLVSWQS